MKGPRLTNVFQAADRIRPHIELIGKQANRPGLFEDIEAACREGKAFLFTITDEDSFVVLRPMPDKIVQVWAAYSKCGSATERYLPAIKALCRMVGAQQIEFETALESVERLMPRFGWKKAFTVWRMSINEN